MFYLKNNMKRICFLDDCIFSIGRVQWITIVINKELAYKKALFLFINKKFSIFAQNNLIYD